MNHDAPTAAPTYSIADLCKATGFTPRQINNFRAKGALQPPEGFGRWARFTQAHLARLAEIQPLFAAGLPVTRIAAHFSNEATDLPPGQKLVQPVISETWSRVRVGHDVEISVLMGGSYSQRRLALLNHLVEEAQRFMASGE